MFELSGGYGAARTWAGAPAPPWTEASEPRILGLVPPKGDQRNRRSRRPPHLVPSQVLPHQLGLLISLARFHN